jgi:hypothetical protein
MENGEVLCCGCGMVGAEVLLREELLRRNRKGDTLKGMWAKTCKLIRDISLREWIMPSLRSGEFI